MLCLAGAIVSGDAPVTGCPVGKSAVAEKIARIMGVECAAAEPRFARVLCRGSREHAAELYEYRGFRIADLPQLTGEAPRFAPMVALVLIVCGRVPIRRHVNGR